MKCLLSLLLLLPGLLVHGQVALPLTPSPAGPGQVRGAEPKDPVGWFRRAYDETNLRMPGSASFQMKVTFHAYPGIDFAKKEESRIVTGDGTYQETWISPHDWRRGVTLGSYHAVEVEADGVRRFQANSDYEPSRVSMLMRALLDPIPRFILEPEIGIQRVQWKLKRLKAGTLPYVRLAHRGSDNSYFGFALADDVYDFLPNGVLFRSEASRSGLVASWQDDEVFAGKVVARRVAVQGEGMRSPMVTAEVSISRLASPSPVIQQLPGKAADVCATLRPRDRFDRSAKFIRRMGSVPRSGLNYPAGVLTVVQAEVDRQGMPREAEVSSIRVYGQPPSREGVDAVWTMAAGLVMGIRQDRVRPAIVDGKPCESPIIALKWKGGT